MSAALYRKWTLSDGVIRVIWINEIIALPQPEFHTVFPYTYFMMNLKQTESLESSISLHTAQFPEDVIYVSLNDSQYCRNLVRKIVGQRSWIWVTLAA